MIEKMTMASRSWAAKQGIPQVAKLFLKRMDPLAPVNPIGTVNCLNYMGFN
jgi:SpoU rRNA methylase family enzyme